MKIPQHVAIILDGNGRWAKSKGMPRNYGHTVGAKNVETVCQAAHDMGIKYLTLYAFSTENWNPIPILFLTAKGEIDDKSKGFEAGADDYMVKPFIAQEFVWRITAILRRTYKESEESSFLLDACKVDLEQAEVYREGQEPVSLTAKEVEILKKLYANAGRIVTLGALCQTVCGDIYIGYEKTLMSHIRHIREKIEEKPSSPVSLVTVKGIGYKLILKDKSR